MSSTTRTAHPITHTGTIAYTVRLNSSRNGNPAFQVTFNGRPAGWADGPGKSFRTQTDSSVGYEIENFDPRRHPEPVTVTLSRAGRITAIRTASVTA